MHDTFLNFSHFNVRSLCAHFDLFSDVIAGSCSDVIGLSETWLSAGVLDSGIAIQNYNIVRRDRLGRGGGVAFYIKNNIRFSVLDIGEDNCPLEQIWISMKIGGKKVSFGSLYRPPNTNLSICIDS